VIQRCAKPLKERTLTSGIEWMQLQVGNFRLIVEFAPTTKKVIQIYHFRETPFTDEEIAKLLEQNAQGQEWKSVNKADAGSVPTASRPAVAGLRLTRRRPRSTNSSSWTHVPGLERQPPSRDRAGYNGRFERGVPDHA
jgi:hypothetical protein